MQYSEIMMRYGELSTKHLEGLYLKLFQMCKLK